MRPVRRLLPALAALLLGACQVTTRPLPPEPLPQAGAVAPSAAAEATATPETPSTQDRRPPARTRRSAPVDAQAQARGADVLERLVARLAERPCVEDRVVQRWERTYARWPARFASQIEAVLPLMQIALEDVEAHHLPGEFVLLPLVESGYRPDAGSPRAAYGLWQFTTATARHQGLRIVPGFDERLAPQAATRAAMRYLAGLQNRFGDWKLANMAFNAGEFRLRRALDKARPEQRRAQPAMHLPPGLSMITYEHLAKVQALACLLAQPQRFGLDLPLATPVEPLHVAAIGAHERSLDRVAQHAGVDPALLRRLNPAFLHGRIVAGARHEVLLPRSAAQRLRHALAKAVRSDPAQQPADSTPRSRHYRVRKGDTLGAIAQRHRVRLRDLLRWNRIDVQALLQPGQVLRLEP